MKTRAVVTFLGIVLSAVSIVIVLDHIDVADSWRLLSGAQLPGLAMAVAALLFQFVVLTVRWRILLSVAADGAVVPYRPIVEAMLVGILANAALPARLGEVARTIVVARRGAIDLAGSAGTVILERILDITVLCGVAVAAALVAGAPWFLSWPLAVAFLGGSAVVILSAAGSVPIAVKRFVLRIPGVAGQPRLEATLRWVGRLIDGLVGHHPRVVVQATLLTIVSVLLDGVIFWGVGHSIGYELTWPQALVLGTAGVLVTGIPSAPANVGTFELAVISVGTTLGVPPEDGLAIALLAHLVIVVPLSVAGAVVVLLSLRSNKALGTGSQMVAHVDADPTDGDGRSQGAHVR